MCKAIEDMLKETMREAMREVALGLWETGVYDEEKIASIVRFSVGEVKELKMIESDIEVRETDNSLYSELAISEKQINKNMIKEARTSLKCMKECYLSDFQI